jgi:hypothetical protein
MYREVTSPQQACAPKTRFGGKTFYFVQKLSGSIPEAAGAFFIEKAQKIMGGSKSAPLHCDLRTVLADRPNPATIPGKHSDTRIKPLPLTNDHGRYISLHPNGQFSVGEWPLQIIVIIL